MGSHWTSKKSKESVEARRVEFELLFNFANADLELEENKNLRTDMLHRLSHHQALHPDNQHRKPEENVPNEIINSLQRHLRARLKEMYTKGHEILWGEELWPISVSIKFIIDPLQGHFREEVQLQKVKAGNEPNAYKKILDLWLIEINRDLNLIPRRFGQCPRCKSFFYKPSEKEKIYCSTNCASAVRVQKFRQAKEDKKK